MKLPTILAILAGLSIAGAGVITVIEPSLLLALARRLQTDAQLYALAAVRVLLGIVLVWASRGARLPRTLAVIGVLMILSGIAAPFFGVARVHELLGRFEGLGPWGMRAAASLAVVLGGFIVYAARPPAA